MFDSVPSVLLQPRVPVSKPTPIHYVASNLSSSSMSARPHSPHDRRKHEPELEVRLRNGFNKPVPHGRFRSIGMGLITGAADDDPAAIGTYAAVGASLGPSFLWTVPVLFPMMFSVVYLCSKLGQVAGEGLFAVVKRHYSAWVLYPILVCALVGNVIEAGADIGGMAAALNLVVPIPIWLIVTVISVVTAGLQIWGSLR